MKIEAVVNALFPAGYVDYDSYIASFRKANKKGRAPAPRRTIGLTPPYWCTDLFAIAAVLLQRSGAYHHVIPDSAHTSAARTLRVSDVERTRWIAAGAAWRGDGKKDAPSQPKALLKEWARLWDLRDSDVFEAIVPNSQPPAWWRPALALFCIADEAARNLGFRPQAAEKRSFQAVSLERVAREAIDDGRDVFSFSTAEPDLVCILPKSRTPNVGCTLRSLSHHLALLPPRGLARACWLPASDDVPPASDIRPRSGVRASENTASGALNCLLVPMPFRIQAKAFKGVRINNERWGSFEIDPGWCAKSAPEDGAAEHGIAEFWTFISGLIAAAEADVGEVHTLVFPEVALSVGVFRRLCELLKSTKVELLISGLFNDDGSGAVQAGNYAAMAVIGDDGFMTVRQKHHRWRLDRSQIQAYALGTSLDPNFGWWENIDILSRSLDVHVLRGTTTVTTLICEDLARHDPCQELVRGIGPNLVFALLMDGPQLKARWPARYATVLAEDPGSSVLTFTSLGLVERSNATGLLAASRIVGLWRDDRGELLELGIPTDAQALCLSLHSTVFTEHTLDGRGDQEAAQSWRLCGIQPVRLNDKNAAKAILDGRWPENPVTSPT